ncbi:AI-2E family transporter [Paenactinomyces guangxiensis]|uniref:AI-2E family transporter n=1 Tax=Paenactinomyces guangxiensis TaxID=1490290 RepID=A0A7W1WN73_9BACL|nr:AI-2E family transporter [Paenactinomyces guangxiensis]MBA4493015.1 AI-2E family transporter [Paenactinomyces guangxiensis]MBH8590136.1 AI-2E family transporter [Paenactinomyces guangxiensis]
MERFNESRWLIRSVLTLVLLGIIFLLLQMNPYIRGLFAFFKAVLGPFFIAMIISYLLNPIVNLLSQRAVPRSVAVLLIYSLFIASVVTLVMNMLPLLEKQIYELAEHFPEWNARIQIMINEYNDHSKDWLPVSIRKGIEKSLSRLEQGISDGVGNMMGGISSTINQIFLAFIIPFLAFYMMKDAKTIEKSMMTLLPGQNRRGLIRLLRDMDRALGNYVRGQLLVCIVVGLLAYIGYLLIGLPYALLLAAIVSVFNLIPYLGPFFGAIPAILVAVTESTEMVIAVIIVNLIVQILEGNVISPQIVGRTLHMHPLFIIFALLVGGELGGIFGLLLAVPLFAMGKVVLEHVIAHYVNHHRT